MDGLGTGLGIHKSGKLASHGEQVYVWVGDGVGDEKRGVGLRKKGNEEKGKKKKKKKKLINLFIVCLIV